MTLQEIQAFLEVEIEKRNRCGELCDEKPDPLMVAQRHPNELFALTCALFAYGNVRAIVSFLSTLPEALIGADESVIRQALGGHYYRFQSSEDIIQWCITLGRLKEAGGAEAVFLEGYHSGGVLEGVNELIQELYRLNLYRSEGYRFLIGKPIVSIPKTSAMKRWMMYLRWMVRHDRLDMGLWKNIDTADLIVPLDTHTFHVSRRFGLLKRNQCDMKAALELTQTLRRFDPKDPVKYDFALYRLGQEAVF